MEPNKAAARVLIMAGGTGGHVFPALAVADCLRASGASVAWLGTRRGIEAELVPAQNIALHFQQTFFPKSLLTAPSNVLPLHFKPTFLCLI